MRTQPGTKLIRRVPLGYPQYLCFGCDADFTDGSALGRHVLEVHRDYSPRDIVVAEVRIALRLPSATDD